MTGCCRGLSAKDCIARPYGCFDGPQEVPPHYGKDKESEGRKTSKSPYFANKYGRPLTGREARVLIVDDPDGDDNGGVAQESGTRLWYALAHALAEKAVADFDRGDVEPDRPGGRRDEEA